LAIPEYSRYVVGGQPGELGKAEREC